METQHTPTPTDIYDKVNALIIKRLEEGSVPWQKPWRIELPQNYLSKKPYRGINCFLLNLLDYEHPYFLTFHQAKELGGKIIKGSHAMPVIYWSWLYFDPLTKKNVYNPPPELAARLEKVPFLKYYNVFNISQIEGVNWVLPDKKNESAILPIQTAERLFQFISPRLPKLQFGGSAAYYSPSLDYIKLPERQQFIGSEEFYATLFHECIHATGHASRLGRKEVIEASSFGSYSYGVEELTAEMGASFMCYHAEIFQPVLDNSVAYLQSWLKAIKADKKLLINASARAQKAVDYLLGNVWEE